jgi:carbon monoxide dehydrogenase subunit G
VELNHSFTVPASVEETWDTFLEIESVASCFPGAVVTSVDGDDFTGTCKVKLGPIALTYSGTGTFIERDQAAGRFLVEAKGKDKRGNGTAGAKVTAMFTDDGGGSTKVDVSTDLQITGKPAQFGRGIIEDVSNKLLQQFVTCLQTKVGADAEQPEPAAEAAAVASEEQPSGPSSQVAASAGAPVTAEPIGSEVPPQSAPSTQTPAPTAETTAPQRTVAPQPAPDNDALDLGATVIPILLKSYWKQLVAVVLAVLLLRRLSKRG